jgi:endonuclease/exonuclease/phosphatase family metal-dependent hydrolase
MRQSLRSVEIATYDDWVATGLSDHVPVIVDIDW